MDELEKYKKENELLREVIKCFPEYVEGVEWGDISYRCPYCEVYGFFEHKEKCIRRVIPSKYETTSLCGDIDESLLPSLDILK